MNKKIRFHKVYFLLMIFFFGIEILIGGFVHDTFIRPFFGDYLVVILIYCFILAFCAFNRTKTALGVLVFSFAIEFMQYFNLVTMLGLEQYRIARILIGTSFSAYDLISYTLGVLTILIIEKRLIKI